MLAVQREAARGLSCLARRMFVSSAVSASELEGATKTSQPAPEVQLAVEALRKRLAEGMQVARGFLGVDVRPGYLHHDRAWPYAAIHTTLSLCSLAAGPDLDTFVQGPDLTGYSVHAPAPKV